MNTLPHPLDGLYHQLVGIPAEIGESLCQCFRLHVGPHARQALVNDRYLSDCVEDGRQARPRFNATDILPDTFTISSPAQLVEVEVSNGRPVKAVVRLPVTQNFSAAVAFIPRQTGELWRALAKTVWLNRKADTHATLNATAYRKP